MIPKAIHYCWFGGSKKPKLAKKCIESWKRFCPDYEIKEWNEDNFDFTVMPFMTEAYKAKKYAFVSDVARLLVLEKYGGIYFDTDVELIKDISPLMNDDGFIGFENDMYVNSGQVIACVPNNPIISEMISEYEKLHFTNTDESYNIVACPHLNSDTMERFGLIRNGKEQIVTGIHVYPSEYFNPRSSITGKLTITADTYSIHWYGKSWFSKSERIKCELAGFCRRMFGENCFDLFKRNKS